MKPRTIEEAMKAFPSVFVCPEDHVEFVRQRKEDLIGWHHGLGQWIRNNWGLWEESPLFGYMKFRGFKHPDDMSMALIHEYWNRMNNKPSTLEEDAAKYAQFWKDKGIDEPC